MRELNEGWVRYQKLIDHPTRREFIVDIRLSDGSSLYCTIRQADIKLAQRLVRVTRVGYLDSDLVRVALPVSPPQIVDVNPENYVLDMRETITLHLGGDWRARICPFGAARDDWWTWDLDHADGSWGGDGPTKGSCLAQARLIVDYMERSAAIKPGQATELQGGLT